MAGFPQVVFAHTDSDGDTVEVTQFDAEFFAVKISGEDGWRTVYLSKDSITELVGKLQLHV